MKCRNCFTELNNVFVDLGTSPPSNSYLTAEQVLAPEVFYPLVVKVCDKCWLVQTEDFANRELFFSPEYAYFSSYSNSWLEHSKRYVTDVVSDRLRLGSNSLVVEIASNDGYLLQFVKEQGIPCLGIEPSKSTADVSREKGVETLCEFFGAKLGVSLARKYPKADLMVANNVLAHVPDVHDFLTGFYAFLSDAGVATFEFPHLMSLVKKRQFDTIYHEHYSYLSLTSIVNVFKRNGLEVFDVEHLATHGGSLRVFAQKERVGAHPVSGNVIQLLEQERSDGMTTLDYYHDFNIGVNQLKNRFLAFLIESKSQGKSVAAYGAAAKGNTFLNYAGIRSDLLSFVVDRNPHKQGKYSHAGLKFKCQG
jgi:hypothetical protein